MRSLNSKYNSLMMISVSCLLFLITACSTQQIEEQKKQRNKLAEQSGFFCEFINGESVAAIDLELNLKMAKRCDSRHSFALTDYRQPNEQRGLIYCCIIAQNENEKGNDNKETKETKSPNKNSDLDALLKIENENNKAPANSNKTDETQPRQPAKK